MVSKKPATNDSAVEDSTQELAKLDLSASTLRDIADIESAIALIRSTTGLEVVNAREEVGDGFEYIENKDRLIGIPILFVKWDCTLSGSFTRDGKAIRCVNVWAIYQRGGQTQKVRFVDFSTGVCAQLWDLYERTGRQIGLAAPNGLRKSEFTYTEDNGDTKASQTYYIDLAASA